MRLSRSVGPPALAAVLAGVLALAVFVLWPVIRSGERASAAPPSATDGRPGLITIGWVGDTMLGSDGALPPDGGRPLFAEVRPWLRDTDLMLGNLEGTLTTGGASKCARPSRSCFAFRVPQRYAPALRWAGFDAMSLANNHAYDYGPQGRADTVAALRAAGIASTGGPGEITVMRRRGVRVALIGFAPYGWAQSSLDIPGAQALVRRARGRADVVVAMMHAGAEGRDKTHTPVGREVAFGEDRGDTRAFAHALVDAGAALVLGSGPHVVRGIERYRGRLIAYSLGNFAGWHNFARSAVSDQSGVLRLRVRGDGTVVGGDWRSVELTGPGIPVPQRSRISAQLVRRLSIGDFGAGAWPMEPSGALAGAQAGAT